MQESKKAIPEPNFFQCPNIIIDEYLKELSGSELKCFLLIIRKTKGWHKDIDAISISQFEDLTGLSNRSVIDACNSLVDRGFIYQDVGQRGVKLFALDCKKFTSEKSSHVKKVHSTYEESSQVTSEKSSHTKESIKYTNKENNIISEQSRIDELTKERDARRFTLPLDWKPNQRIFSGYCSINGILPDKLTDNILSSFNQRANAKGEVKNENEWCLYLAKYLKTCLNNPTIKKPNPHIYQPEKSGQEPSQSGYEPSYKPFEPLTEAEKTKTPQDAVEKMRQKLRGAA